MRSRLRDTERAGTINSMKAKACVMVDFHLSPDGEHTFASTADVSPAIDLTTGDLVEATDGELIKLAVVDSVDGRDLSLVVLWETPVSFV